MVKNVSLEEAKEGLESLGMWMDARYNSRFVGTPIQEWDMPRKEKGFFTVYAMNLVLESDGFDCFVGQKSDDVEAFIHLLQKLGAKKTATFVRSTLTALKTKQPCDEDKCTSDYYKLFEREKIWLKLLDYVGRPIYVRYVLRAQAIQDAGQNIFDARQWQGELPDA
jgi:hypothetical protein